MINPGPNCLSMPLMDLGGFCMVDSALGLFILRNADPTKRSQSTSHLCSLTFHGISVDQVRIPRSKIRIQENRALSAKDGFRETSGFGFYDNTFQT
jgi:hypothetical protein